MERVSKAFVSETLWQSLQGLSRTGMASSSQPSEDGNIARRHTVLSSGKALSHLGTEQRMTRRAQNPDLRRRAEPLSVLGGSCAWRLRARGRGPRMGVDRDWAWPRAGTPRVGVACPPSAPARARARAPCAPPRSAGLRGPDVAGARQRRMAASRKAPRVR